MANGVKIAIVEDVKRVDWRTIEDWQEMFSDEQIVEMLHRYMDAQSHAKNYRERAADRTKLLKEKVAALAKAQGLTVDQFVNRRVDVTTGEVQ